MATNASTEGGGLTLGAVVAELRRVMVPVMLPYRVVVSIRVTELESSPTRTGGRASMATAGTMGSVSSVMPQPAVASAQMAVAAVLLKLTDIPDADPTQPLLELTDRRCSPSSTYSIWLHSVGDGRKPGTGPHGERGS
ncbi:hypothetical protein ACFZDJ_53540 [Streptomyces sp. NPDC007896]|uniref:hypothetical protein n=1 Tax=Streptomyces sp. NPDC007896 TaxID=3364784 RepID=UPI0036E33F79